MSLAMHIQLPVWLGVAGLSLICSAISLSTQTHCILVTSGDMNRQAVCPGETINVGKHVEIVAGFDDNSKFEDPQTPRWQQSFMIEPRSVVDMRGPGFSPEMQTAYWGTDDCLYGNPQMYPIMAPPVFSKPNHDYQKMGCATQQYAGPAIENPWSILNYGTATPDTSEPSDSDGSFLDQLRFYRDYEPLYRVLHDGQKKSDAGTSPSDATASADTSLFNADLADTSSSDRAGTDLLSAFLPSSDDSSYSDITWDVNSDPGSNLFVNVDSGTNLSASDDSGPDPSASSDFSSNFAFLNDDVLFTRKRSRRSARDFLRRDNL